MITTNHHRLIILGSGPAGCTAAIYAARANLSPLLIAGSLPGGQLLTTTQIDNWPGEEKGIGGAALMDKMLKQAARFQTEIVYDQIISTNLKQRPFLLTGENTTYTCDALIIATGASARYLRLPSEKEFMGRGVSACATCDGYFYRGAKVAVVGGGNTAVEEALYLAEIAAEVTLIHRRDQLRAEPIMVDKLLAKVREHKIKVEWNSVVTEVIGTNAGVTGLNLQNVSDNTKKTIAVTGVFIAIGHQPNTEAFREQLTMEQDYIVVQPKQSGFSTATSIAGVFAAGDVADPTYRQAITSAGAGCMAALDAKKYLYTQTM